MDQQVTRKIVKFFSWVFIVITVLTFLIWLNNVVIALKWNPKASQEVTYHGLFRRFDVFAVDFSTVTTFIPFFGSLLITLGFFRAAKAKPNSNISEYFPFFKNYIPITVALGLIGTVWGLIMIGYYDPKEIEMSQLIECLHTALYSTFIALLWVFLFVYPMRYIMQRAYRFIAGYKKLPGTENILSLLNNLGSATAVATKNIKAFNGQVVNVKNELKLKETGDFLKTFKEGKEKIVSEANSLFKLWRESAEEQQKTGQQLQEILKSFSTVAEERNLRIKAEERAAQSEKVKKDLRKVREFFQQLNLER